MRERFAIEPTEPTRSLACEFSFEPEAYPQRAVHKFGRKRALTHIKLYVTRQQAFERGGRKRIIA